MLRKGTSGLKEPVSSFYKCSRKLSSSVASTSSLEGIRSREWSLLPTSRVVVPSFELTRTCGNVFSETIYSLFFEKTYKRDRFLKAAMNSVPISASYIADRNWEGLSRIASQDLVETLREAREKLTPEQVQLLRFSEEDVICSFLYSSLFSGRNVFKLSESGNMFIYLTSVTYIRLNENVPLDASPTTVLSRHSRDCLFANTTFSRSLNPLGPWKATHINFFSDSEHSQVH